VAILKTALQKWNRLLRQPLKKSNRLLPVLN